jgi:hypothetical protein
MEKYVRVVAEPTVENGEAPPLFLDAVIDSENEIRGDSVIFAFQGDMNNRHGRSLPFILHADGRVDWGEMYDSSEQYGELDLRDGKVIEGRLLHLRGAEFGEQSFRIVQVISLV